MTYQEKLDRSLTEYELEHLLNIVQAASQLNSGSDHEIYDASIQVANEVGTILAEVFYDSECGEWYVDFSQEARTPV